MQHRYFVLWITHAHPQLTCLLHEIRQMLRTKVSPSDGWHMGAMESRIGRYKKILQSINHKASNLVLVQIQPVHHLVGAYLINELVPKSKPFTTPGQRVDCATVHVCRKTLLSLLLDRLVEGHIKQPEARAGSGELFKDSGFAGSRKGHHFQDLSVA